MRGFYIFTTYLFFILAFSQFSYAQLTNFSLIVSKTDESCTGNATLSFNASGTTGGSTIIYNIYKLPNNTAPIAVLSANTFTGLSAGTYRVIATQSLGNLSNTQQQDIQILDTRTVVTYQLTSQATSCNTGNIIVSVLTGHPVTYEIISGLGIISPQASNIFTNLSSGVYNIRVNDNCGEGVVQTFTLNFVNPPNLSLGNFVTFCELSSCATISGQILINSNIGTPIRYPLSIQCTAFPPGGGTPVVVNQTINSGNLNNLTATLNIPFYNAQAYTFDIKVTDACGNIYTKDGNQIQKQFSVSASESYFNCIKGIKINVCNFLPPYTINFISAPSGFNPSSYNALHPGPFTNYTVSYLSTAGNEIPNGNYTIGVTDACGRFVQTQVTIQDVDPGYVLLFNTDVCNTNTTVRIPYLGPNVSSVIITSAPSNFNHPLPYDVSFNINSGVFEMSLPAGTYTFQGFDVCGKPFNYTITIPPKVVALDVTGINATGCNVSNGSIKITVTGALLSSIIITQAPAAFLQNLPYNASALIISPNNNYALIPNLPIGNYTLDITDSCGIHYFYTIVIAATISQTPLLFYDKKGCGENYDSILFYSPNGILQSMIITSAPATFPHQLPYNVSNNIATDGVFYMNSLPEGTYTFNSIDICNVIRTETVQIIGYHQIDDDIQVIGNCGSFDLKMNYLDNNSSSHNFWLQQFNPITNQWVHPLTGVPYGNGTIPNQNNSYLLSNLTTNYNISSSGTFRVLMEYYYYSNGSPDLLPCVEPVQTFDFSEELKIISAYGIPCINGGSQVYIVAQGIAPLNYKITSKDGQPFVVNNGTSPIFSGLQPGIYNFRVQDLCGNIVNRLFDIATLPEPSITPNNLCNGSNGTLSVEPFAFLNYQWWKGTNTSTILSTTNVLSFNPFSNATSSGTYYVRIYSPNGNSCIDRTLTFTIPLVNNPNAGQDGNLIICGNTSAINLFSLLSGNYDTGGVWEENTSSGMLSGNTWLPVGIPFGTYTFKYKVTGFCHSFDESIVTIQFNPSINQPILSANPNYCKGDTIHFIVQPINNVIFNWIGPNNFSSSTQNPIITNSGVENSGLYTVTASLNGCSSSSSINVLVNPIPDYTFESSCIGGAYTLLITPVNDSFNPNTATYLWSGPNGYTNVNNPIIITNKPNGIYTATVINIEGCPVSKSINVSNTFCDFPNVISPNNDGSNDFLDLSGYDISKFQVFNRWGKLVYEQNDANILWYGQNMNGGILPDSTYFYFLELKTGEEKHGWLFISKGM